MRDGLHIPGSALKGRVCLAAALLYLVGAVAVSAQTNLWVNLNSGRWDDTNSWSLGILPNCPQSVFIQNTNPTTVQMDFTTAKKYPSSFCVNSLTVGTSNTLAMSNTGEEALTAANGISLAGGTMALSNAVVNSPINGTNAVVVQTGGLVNGGLSFDSGNYFLTNGQFRGDVTIYNAGSFARYGNNSSLQANSFGGVLIQNGGSVNINVGDFTGETVLNSGDLQCGSIEIINQVTQNGGTATFSVLTDHFHYFLNAGMLSASNLRLSLEFGGSLFDQEGGTNNVGVVSIESGSFYHLYGGAFNAGAINLYAGRSGATFDQKNVTAVITNQLYLEGSAYHYAWFGTPATYQVTNGTLSVGSIVLNGSSGDCNLNLSDSTVSVAGTIEIDGLTWAPGNLVLSGGSLACSNVVNNGGTEFVQQTGGTFIVTNRFVYGGYYPLPLYPLPWPLRHAIYSFGSGTLSAADIELDAEMVVGDSTQPRRITNPGHFQLAGLLSIGNANEQLGKFVLASQTITNIDQGTTFVTNNAYINFIGNNTTLAFADSHSETWSDGATLTISNWNGSINGSGNDQLRFGTNGSGLTAAQVGQLRFLNPAGFPEGTYAARILSTGEVVPYAPSVSASRTTDAMVIAWPDGSYTLQGATNVTGPWTNVVSATSPYTNNFSGGPIGFFRLIR